MKQNYFSKDELTVLESMSVQGGEQADPDGINIVCPVNKTCPSNTNCTKLTVQGCSPSNSALNCNC